MPNYLEEAIQENVEKYCVKKKSLSDNIFDKVKHTVRMIYFGSLVSFRQIVM